MNDTPVTQFLSDKEVEVLKRTLLSGFTEDEQESFVRLCQRTLLDPFSKQIYATRRWVKDRQGNKTPALVPVTSVIGLTAIAARTGHYNGCIIQWVGKDHVWKDEWLEEEFPLAAKAIVYHKQRTHPEVGIAHWAGYCGQSYDQGTKRWEVSEFWERLGPFMLGKCAKAQALRGAFPDQCSNLYISEELQGGISEADEINDEDKIAENRRREAELMKSTPKGVKVVSSKPAPQPTPAEAAEPAFPEDKPPSKVSAPSSPAVQSPLPASPTEPAEPDDLDMAEPPPPVGPAGTPGGAPVVESAKPWSEHQILGLKNPKFHQRKVGDLSVAELTAIETQWIPKVRAVWENVNKNQQADVLAFEAAIAYYKMEKPWSGS